MTDTNSDNHILVAPLNWGLGHATRCIPIINALEENGFVVGKVIPARVDYVEAQRKY